MALVGVILDAGERVGEVLEGIDPACLTHRAEKNWGVVENPESEPRGRLYDAGDSALDLAA